MRCASWTVAAVVCLVWISATVGEITELSGHSRDLPQFDPSPGFIGQHELDGVLLNWGDTVAPGSLPVPEPNSLALFALASLILLGTARDLIVPP